MIDQFLTRIANARGFAGKLWVLVRPYWFAEERQTLALWGYSVTVRESWIARALLAVIVGLSIIVVYISKEINSWNARFFNALQDKNVEAFQAELIYWGVLVFFFIVALVYRAWLRQLLTIRWRRWLSEVYFRDWLADRTYYRMELTSQGTDNPEQRIEQDCNTFATQTLELTLDLFLQVLTFVTFAFVLWNLSGSFVLPIFGGLVIPGYMMWAALLYALVGSLATHLIGRPLIGINFALERYNADFRYRMVRIRENAESIALYRGEADEARNLRGAFARIYGAWWDFMKYTKRLTWLTAFYGQAAQIFPIIVAAPQYFAGQIPLGTLTQTADAFAQVQQALSWFVDTYPRLAAWKAVVDRLTTFGEAMAKAKAAQSETGFEVRPQPQPEVALNAVEVQLPNGAPLLEDVNVAVRKGQSTVVRGPSGQRQDHAVSRARRPVAVRPGQYRNAAGCPRAVPAAETLSADRHAQGHAVLSGPARPSHRCRMRRGARRLRAGAARVPARRGNQLVACPVGGRAAAHRVCTRIAVPAGVAVSRRGDLGAGRGSRTQDVRAPETAAAGHDADQRRAPAVGRRVSRRQLVIDPASRRVLSQPVTA